MIYRYFFFFNLLRVAEVTEFAERKISRKRTRKRRNWFKKNESGRVMGCSGGWGGRFVTGLKLELCMCGRHVPGVLVS